LRIIAKMRKEIFKNPPVDMGRNLVCNPVTREAVNERTHQLAKLAGRKHPDITQADYEQAKEEITGESDKDKQNEALDAPQKKKR
jgi:hypothetical protein